MVRSSFLLYLSPWWLVRIFLLIKTKTRLLKFMHLIFQDILLADILFVSSSKLYTLAWLRVENSSPPPNHACYGIHFAAFASYKINGFISIISLATEVLIHRLCLVWLCFNLRELFNIKANPIKNSCDTV